MDIGVNNNMNMFVLTGLPRITAPDYPFGIFILSLRHINTGKCIELSHQMLVHCTIVTDSSFVCKSLKIMSSYYIYNINVHTILFGSIINSHIILFFHWNLKYRNYTIIKTKWCFSWLTAMEYLCHKWPWICSTCRKHFPVLSSFMIYDRVCN
jgi:hypothetical protein